MRAALLWLLMAISAAAQSYVGHGGPVKSLAIDGGRMLTASFDYSVGLWALDAPDAPRWLEGHAAAVNCVAFLPEGRAVSGGDDFAVIIWDMESGAVLRRLDGHQGKVMAVAPSPDGGLIASASWDGTARVWDAQTGATTVELTDHRGAVNDAVWSADGAHLYTAGADGAVLEWNAADWTVARRLAEAGFGVNVLALDSASGWLATGAVDGGTRIIALEDGALLADLTAGRRPILALARSPDGAQLAVGDGEGHIMVVATADWSVERDFRAAGYGPIWALDFTSDGAALVAAGIDDEAHLWPLDADLDAPLLATTARGFHVDPGAVSNGERQFRRKCAICHTLRGDTARRAGPALEGVFGRRAGALPGYPYSQALRDSGVIWDAQTIDALFAEGPEGYVPGSKMPMQRIAAPQDRADLIAFLKAATTRENAAP